VPTERTLQASAPARHARRLGFALVGYAFLVTMLGTTLPTPLYSIYQRQLGFSPLVVTVIFAVYAVAVVATLLLAGRLSDEIGRRPVLVAAMLFSAASAVCFLLTHGLTLVLVGRAFSGISAGLFTGSGTAALLDLTEESGRARATAIGVGVNLGGLAAGTMLAGLLAEWAPDPLRLPYVIDLGLAAAGVVALLAVPETVPDRSRLRLRFERLGIAPEVRSVFLPAVLAGGAGFAVIGVLTAVSSIFLATALGLTSHALAGFVVFLAMGSVAAGQLAVRRIRETPALIVGAAALVASAVLLGVALGATLLAPLLAGALLVGIGTGLSVGAGLAAINNRAPVARRGETASTFFAVIYAALALPAIGVGIAGRLLGLRDAGVAFSIAVALVAAGVLVLLLVRPTGAEPVS